MRQPHTDSWKQGVTRTREINPTHDTSNSGAVTLFHFPHFYEEE